MAETGSRRWFGYTADNGDDFAVELDESVGESASLGFSVVADGAIVLSATSTRPLKMRYINAYKVVDDITIRHRYWVGTVAAFTAIAAAGSATIDGSLWSVSSVIGERRKTVPISDSAQLDGDLDSN